MWTKQQNKWRPIRRSTTIRSNRVDFQINRLWGSQHWLLLSRTEALSSWCTMYRLLLLSRIRMPGHAIRWVLKLNKRHEMSTRSEKHIQKAIERILAALAHSQSTVCSITSSSLITFEILLHLLLQLHYIFLCIFITTLFKDSDIGLCLNYVELKRWSEWEVGKLRKYYCDPSYFL